MSRKGEPKEKNKISVEMVQIGYYNKAERNDGIYIINGYGLSQNENVFL